MYVNGFIWKDENHVFEEVDFAGFGSFLGVCSELWGLDYGR
jgi:hypothetical protein